MSPRDSLLRALAPQLPSLALTTLHDRITGTLLGSALGDAVGLYTEFLSAEESLRCYPSGHFTLHPPSSATPFRRDFHRGPKRPGDWTDDTDHSLLILLSFLHNRGSFDVPDFAARLKIWVDCGLRALDTLPLGLGATVGAIVKNAKFVEDPEGVAYELWVRKKRDIAPNGSLMRTHPLGLMCVAYSQEDTFDVAGRYSVVTHVDPRCIVSCAIGTDLVRGLAMGLYTEESHIDAVVDAAVAWYTPWAKKRDETLRREGEPPLDVDLLYKHTRAQNLSELELDDAQSMGYVYKCLGSGVLLLRLAMRTLWTSPSPLRTQTALFEELITKLVMCGGDADTNACFAGALLGAYLGYKALPPHWRDGLRHGDWLMGKAEGLCSVLGASARPYDARANGDTAPDGGRGVLTEKEVEERFKALHVWMLEDYKEHHKRREEEEKKKKTKKGPFGFGW